LILKELGIMADVHPSAISMAELGILNKQGSPACGRTVYPKLKAALGLDQPST
jgi:hypothetical protein